MCNWFAKEDIWNVDEWGLNYAVPPDHTISQTEFYGRERLTLLVCPKASGTEKFPLVFIGSANTPRCFEKKTGAEPGFDYASNNNS